MQGERNATQMHGRGIPSMRWIPVLVTMLLTALFSSCSVLKSPFAPSLKLNTTEQMMWSTYLIGSEKGMGAGFILFRHDADQPGSAIPVMVTAAHLIEAAGQGPLFIGARMPDDQGGASITLIEFLPGRGDRRFYVKHPEHDIAAFELRLPVDAARLVALPSFLLNKRRGAGGALRAGEEVSFVGFPETLPEMEGLFPVLRTGRVASYPVGTSRSGGVFVINADVYPGDSGGPVFLSGKRGRPELAGMIIRRVGSDKKAFSHLAIAVEARLVQETMALLDARDAEHDAPANRKQ